MLGSGPPIVLGSLIPFGHIERAWQIPDLRAWYERLAQLGTVVHYDARGMGMSQRTPADVSVEAHASDIAAVVDAAGEDPVTLIGPFHSGPAAVTFAAEHPARVQHLVLWCTYARGEDYWKANQAIGLRNLRHSDYEMFLRTAAHEVIGWDQGPQAAAFAEVMQAAVEPDEADRLISALAEVDVSDLLARVIAPTLVLHRRQLQWLDVELSRAIAAAMADARLAIVDGRSPLPGVGDMDAAFEAIAGFMGVEPGWSGPQPEGSVRAVLFTDLVDHTALMNRLGDERGREVLRGHESVIRTALAEHGGAEVKALGDGLMASFGSVTRAVECAIEIQRGIDAFNADRDDEPVQVRVGLHAGEPVEEDGDLFGSSVILASRITTRAAGGQILASGTVRDLTAGKGFGYSDAGEFIPKGFEDPIPVWEVDWRS
jgi:class 3 adenylate cyclase